MSYRNVRGPWWPARQGRTRASGAPLLPVLGRRGGLRSALALLVGLAIAWLLVDVGQWLFFERDPALRLDPARGLIPISNTQALRTAECPSYQGRFNAFGSVRLPAPRVARHRVLLLGDSESASYALDPRYHYGTLLARRFPDVEFVCQAQPNYSMADFIRIARNSRGFDDYDLVVIQGCDQDVGPEAFERGRGRGLAVAKLSGDSVTVSSEALGWTGQHLRMYNALTRNDAVGRRLESFARDLTRLLRHPLRKAKPAASGDARVDISAMGPMLRALRRSVVPPMLWLNLPRLHGVGEQRHPETVESVQFVAGLKAAGITVADASEPLYAFRSKSGGYANGSDASVPGTGHLNADGHRILFAAVAPLVDSVLSTPARRR